MGSPGCTGCSSKDGELLNQTRGHEESAEAQLLVAISNRHRVPTIDRPPRTATAP